MIAEQREIRYSSDFPGGRIFEQGEEIPEGYVDHPGKIAKAAPKKRRGRPRKVDDSQHDN
ncbi:MAG: hypothetical protein KJO69_07345 [Gammaproteobacteria bacterium]|nr:hypothetical protein [Gammaproteobacteria bacterium]